MYKPIKMNIGEKSWCRDQEKKEEFLHVILVIAIMMNFLKYLEENIQIEFKIQS
jgi:hypothetical protein